MLDGTYKPGDRLLELQIAREFNSSQGPVREALRELEALRLVESQVYRGTRVRGVNAREMREGLPGARRPGRDGRQDGRAKISRATPACCRPQ